MAPYLALLLAATMMAAAAAAGAGCDIVVQPPSFSGSSCNHEICTALAPVSTLAAAQASARALLKSGSCTPVAGSLVRVHLRAPAVYFVNETLTLGPQDSGTGPDGVVEWLKMEGDEGEAVVSAGAPVTGWTKVANPNGGARPALQASVDPSATPFAQFFTSDSWRQRSRIPSVSLGDEGSRGLAGNSTLFWSTSLQPCRGGKCPEGNKLGFHYDSGFDPSWHALENVSVIAFQSWTATWARIASIDAASRTVMFQNPMPEPIGQYTEQGGRRIVVENVREGLDEPGEWYWDPAEGGALTYLPTDAELGAIAGGIPVDKVLSAVRPRLGTALSLDGASFVRISGIVVAHATDGGDRVRETSYFVTTAAVTVRNASDVSMDGVRVRLSGGSGVVLRSGVRNFRWSRGGVRDVGGEALSFAYDADDAQNCSVSDAVFNGTGRVFMMQTGVVRLRGASGIVLENCEISHGPYAGVMVGWQRGWPTPGPSAPVLDPVFVVRRNRVHDFGLGILSDFGGIYVSSNNNTCWRIQECATRLLVEGNWVSGGRHYDYGSHGFYSDEQAASINVTGNIFQDIGSSCIFHHCGDDQSTSNNIAVTCGRQHPRGSYLASCNSGGNPTWPSLPHGFSSRLDVWSVDTAGGSPLTSDSDYRAVDMDSNVYWQDGGATSLLVFPGGRTFAEWRATGNATRSVVADPRIADAAAGNFTLLPGSPALAMGFRQIDQASIGPRPPPAL